MRYRDTKRSRTTLGGHRHHHHSTQVIVHFGGRHPNTRPRFPDFAPDSRVKIYEPNLPTPHQVSSTSPSLLNSPIASVSSPAAAIFLAASAQPVRAGLAGRRNTSAPPSMVMAAPISPFRPNCARTGLGITIP